MIVTLREDGKSGVTFVYEGLVLDNCICQLEMLRTRHIKAERDRLDSLQSAMSRDDMDSKHSRDDRPARGTMDPRRRPL